MKRRAIVIGLLSSVLGGGGALLASCSDDPAAVAGDSGAPDVTATNEAGDGTVVVDTGAADSGPDVPIIPPICDPAATWSTGVLLAASTANLDRFGSVSADELSIAWMVPIDTSDGGLDAGNDSGDGGDGSAPTRPTGDVYYADRAATTDAFGAPQKVDPSPGYYALDRVALSADGLRIVVVRDDGLALGEVVRATRSGAFGLVDESAFAAINVSGSETIPPDTYMGDPVLSPSGKSLVFSVYGATTSGVTIFVTLRDDPTMMFRTTGPEVATELQAAAGKRRRPSGFSADERTLFFWDEMSGTERAGWRGAVLANFTQFVDLGPRMFAQPNPSCRRLYYAGQGSTSVDLFSADIK